MVQKIIVKDLKMNVPIVWEVMNTVFLFIIFLKIVVISKVKLTVLSLTSDFNLVNNFKTN